MSALGEVPTLKRMGSKYTREWDDGTTATGYDIGADGAQPFGWRQLGFAEQVIELSGRKRGWIIRDHRTGTVIFGAGDSTRIGYGLSDCLYLFAKHLIASRSGE